MERLTVPAVVKDGKRYSPIIDGNKVREHAMDFYWRLKEYEDAEEQGLLLRPKLALNQIVYMRSDYWGITPYEVCDICLGIYGFYYEVFAFRYDELLDDQEIDDNDIGKTVFLTKEEAEQALKGGAV